MKIKYFTKITFTKENDSSSSIFELEVVFEYEQTAYDEVKRIAYEKASFMEVPKGYIKIVNFEIINEEKIV